MVGVPDERWGQRVVALVELRPGRTAPDLTELQDHCRPLIAAGAAGVAVVSAICGQPDVARATADLAAELDAEFSRMRANGLASEAAGGLTGKRTVARRVSQPE